MANENHREGFRKAMEKEWFEMMEKYEVISDYVHENFIPEDALKIHMLWRMEFKPDREGDEKYRARLVARGDQEKLESDVNGGVLKSDITLFPIFTSPICDGFKGD